MTTTPDYIRIADAIVEDARAGKLVSGDKLPSIAQLCVQYACSAGTVKMAFIRLEALRVIIRKQGKGVYVADPSTWMREP